MVDMAAFAADGSAAAEKVSEVIELGLDWRREDRCTSVEVRSSVIRLEENRYTGCRGRVV